MPRVAAQAQERSRLMQQIVGNRAVWIVTNAAILRHRGMLIGKWSLLLRVAPVTHHVDGGLSQVIFRLTMCIVAVGTHHLAFLDRMVRRHRVLGVNLWMAFVADVRLVHGHRQSIWAFDGRVADIHDRLHEGVRMGIVAVGARHAVQTVR